MTQTTGAGRTHRNRRHPEGWEVGRLLGVPVVLARSWFLIAGAVTLLFGPSIAQREPALGASAYVVAFVYAVLLLVSVLVHELGHAVVARATGTPASRIVLNLWGGHTQFEAESTTPGRSMLVAVVGPLTNAVIAVIGWFALAAVDADGVTYLLLLALALTNGFVAVFNLVPGLPLDGGRVLEALIWKISGDRSAGMVAAGWVGRAFAVLLVAWVLLRPLLQGQQPGLVSVVWSAMIGALLWQGAGEAIRSAGVRRRLAAATAGALVRPAVAVDWNTSVDDALRLAATHGVREVVLVAPDGRPAGVLDPAAADAVPADRRSAVRTASAARALPDGAVVDVRLSGQALLDALSRLPGEEWVGVDGAGRVVGVLRSADVVAAILPRRT